MSRGSCSGHLTIHARSFVNRHHLDYPDRLSSGVIPKFIMPGDNNEPSGFIVTTILGIVGAFVASYLGQALGWYSPGEGAGLVGAVVGRSLFCSYMASSRAPPHGLSNQLQQAMW
jgi:uncharacterized membrane protein YeaQ/YmgE (transglycosylase-associated protein family)